MTGVDIFDHVAALVYPLPVSADVDPALAAAIEAVHAERRRHAAALREEWEQHEADPVLAELERLTALRRALDESCRQIVAYAREYSSDRSHTQARLAAAAGLRTHSSVRSYYGESEIAAVATATGAKRLTTKTKKRK